MRCLAPALPAFILAGHLCADTIHVPGDHATIQGAIDAASDGDLIEVAPGTYEESLFPGTKSFHLRGSVDAEGVPTTFVISSNDSAIRLSDNDSADLLFENLRLRGPSNWSLSRGGGFYCRDSRPTLRNCLFDGCTALNGSYNYGGGAFALCQFSDHTPRFIDCTFIDCRAHYGGGLYFYVHTSSDFVASVSLRGCAFINNEAEEEGGAIHLYGESGVHIEDCYFASNATGGLASGIKHAYACYTTVADSIFCSDDPTSVHIRSSYTELGGNCFTDDCTDSDGDGMPDGCIPTSACREDANGDGYVDGADLGLLIASWGPSANCAVDVNVDGQVDGADLGLLIARWGACN